MTKNNEKTLFKHIFIKLIYSNENVRSTMQPFISITHFGTKSAFSYSHGSNNTMLFSMLVLVLYFYILSIYLILKCVTNCVLIGSSYFSTEHRRGKIDS